LPVIGALLAGFVMALAFTLTVAGCSSGTNGGPGRGGRGAPPQPQWPKVYEIITTLELEPEQLPAARAILVEAEDARTELHAEMTSRMTGGRPDPSTMSSMRERMDEISETAEDQLSEILTTEQMTAYNEMMREAQQAQADMRSQKGVRPGGGPGGGPPGGW
jgi:hypothetical protein